MRKALQTQFFSSVRDTQLEIECVTPLDFSKLNALTNMSMTEMHEFWLYEIEYWNQRRSRKSSCVCLVRV